MFSQSVSTPYGAPNPGRQVLLLPYWATPPRVRSVPSRAHPTRGLAPTPSRSVPGPALPGLTPRSGH